jgi:hypothetical protein
MVAYPFTIIFSNFLHIAKLRLLNGYLLTDLFLYTLARIMVGLSSLALIVGMLAGITLL